MTQLATQNQKMDSVRALLARADVMEAIAKVAPKHLTPDRITRIAMTSIMRTPKLADCTPQSLLGALLTCTQLGLEPDDAGGRAYLIPYGTTCTLIIGYKGLMELARRSGDITGLEARVVYDCDAFDYQYGSDPSLTHKPKVGVDKKNPVAVYAVARLKSGEHQFEVMDVSEVNAIRDRAKSKSGPWSTDYTEMARKTVMRRLCKYLPSSPELSQAVTLDEQADANVTQSIAPVMFDLKPRAQLSGLDALSELSERAEAVASCELDGETQSSDALDEQSEQRQPVPVADALPKVADKTPAPVAVTAPKCTAPTYKAIYELWEPLSNQERAAIRKNTRDFKSITHVQSWSQSDAQDLLDHLRAEHPAEVVA